jgi:hypothetical protein
VCRQWSPKPPTSPGGGCTPLWTGILTGAQLTLSRHYLVGIWHGGVLSRSLSGYVTTFGEACVPTLGLEGGVWFNPRVTFDGKVRNLGPCVLNFDSSLPEEHRANILSFLFLSTDNSLRYQCKLGGGSTSISCTSVTVYRGSKRGRRVVTGTAKTSKVGLSYHRRQGSSPHSRHAGVLRPGLNRRRPGSLYWATWCKANPKDKGEQVFREYSRCIFTGRCKEPKGDGEHQEGASRGRYVTRARRDGNGG